jgi:hypothetical protein
MYAMVDARDKGIDGLDNAMQGCVAADRHGESHHVIVDRANLG